MDGWVGWGGWGVRNHDTHEKGFISFMYGVGMHMIREMMMISVSHFYKGYDIN